MPSVKTVIIVVAVVVALGLVLFPIINKRLFCRMPFEQQIRILMKQANKLIYWKNISNGTSGTLVYIKNKRKILAYPWVLMDGRMLCTKADPYDHWDYPEDQPKFTLEEIEQAKAELEKYNSKCLVKLYLQEND